MLKTFKFCQNAVKNNPFIVLLLVAGLGLLLIPDAYAFSAPVVKTTENVTKHIVLIGIAACALAIAYFFYTFLTGEPAWKRAFYTLIAITGFTSFTAIVSWAINGMR